MLCSSNHQHFFLNDTLVAPIWNSAENLTTVPVWIPPGMWQDVWSGETVVGPQNINASQPYERLPMWHRVGGLTITTSEPGLRVELQDWSELTLEAFPASWREESVVRRLYNRKTLQPTEVRMQTDGRGLVEIVIAATPDGDEHSWVVRLHLRPGQNATLAAAGVNMEADAKLTMIAPLAVEQAHAVMPFKGKGSAPAPHAGAVAEVQLTASAQPRRLAVVIGA